MQSKAGRRKVIVPNSTQPTFPRRLLGQAVVQGYDYEQKSFSLDYRTNVRLLYCNVLPALVWVCFCFPVLTLRDESLPDCSGMGITKLYQMGHAIVQLDRPKLRKNQSQRVFVQLRTEKRFWLSRV